MRSRGLALPAASSQRLASVGWRRRLAIGALVWQGAAIVAAAIFLAPLIWLIVASLQPVGQPPLRMLNWFPNGIAWSNYVEVFRIAPLTTQLGNSLLVSAVGAGVTVVTASWAGFAMAQMPPVIRRWLVGLALLLMLVPSSAVWLPRYILFAAIGLLDTYVVLVAPALLGTKSLLVLMYYWTFRRISSEMFESAALDGASVGRSWWSIALPLAAPTTLAVAILAFSHYWSDFVDPLLLLKSAQRFTVAVGLRMLQQMDVTNWSLLMAAVVIMIAPVIALYLILQSSLRGGANLVQRIMRLDSKDDKITTEPASAFESES
ncbi:MAG: sugar ABC transporter permease [Chloroflexota bacterium]|nr:MAG: sugar ABC transporter permease [Chloroflexota bacterium]